MLKGKNISQSVDLICDRNPGKSPPIYLPMHYSLLPINFPVKSVYWNKHNPVKLVGQAVPGDTHPENTVHTVDLSWTSVTFLRKNLFVSFKTFQKNI